MNCMNCKAEVPENSGRLIVQTFVCVACSKMITQLRTRLIGEVEGLLVRMDAVLRHVVTSTSVTETYVDRRLKVADVLTFLVLADESATEEACRNTKKMIPSTESSQLSVPIADGKRSSLKH